MKRVQFHSATLGSNARRVGERFPIFFVDDFSIFMRAQSTISTLMSTKAPSTVKPSADNSLERIAYASVATIPTVEPHDQDRLGYSVWRWLKDRRDTLEQSVHNAGSRLLISEEEALRKIRESLKAQGVQL